MSNIYKGLHIEMEGKQLRGLVNGRDGGPLICHESEVIFVFRYFVTINETVLFYDAVQGGRCLIYPRGKDTLTKNRTRTLSDLSMGPYRIAYRCMHRERNYIHTHPSPIGWIYNYSIRRLVR